MKALLLAAGLGTRLQPLTDHIPKCLVRIEGKPLLEYWITMLCNGGIYPLLVNLHHHADKVAGFINNSQYKEFISTAYEEILLGTGGTLLKNRYFFDKKPKEPFMLVHADNLSLFDVHAFVNSHQNRPAGCEMTMMTFKTTTPHTCGIVETNEKGCVQAFHEKVANPPGDMANGAVYIVEPSIFDYLKSLNKECIDFSTEVIPYFMGRIHTFHNDMYHRDIGTMESYEVACQEFPKIANEKDRILADTAATSLKWSANINEIGKCLQSISASQAEAGNISVDGAFGIWSDMTVSIKKRKRTIFLIGNGASASMASHVAADLAKNGHVHTEVFSDLSLITAIANDLSYDEVFAEPLRRRMKSGDMLVAISSSGQSLNVLKAVKEARILDGFVVTLTAMKSDNTLASKGDLNFYVPASTYGLAETCHAAVLHHWIDKIVERNTPQNS